MLNANQVRLLVAREAARGGRVAAGNFIKTSLAEAQELLDKALKELPDLAYGGLGLAKGDWDLGEIAAAADWLKRQGRRTTINTRHDAYAFKHYVERFYDLYSSHVYVSTGSLIAAAVGLGFTYRRDRQNILLGISEAGLRLQDRSEDLRRAYLSENVRRMAECA